MNPFVLGTIDVIPLTKSTGKKDRKVILKKRSIIAELNDLKMKRNK
jgi:hypothetical protein